VLVVLEARLLPKRYDVALLPTVGTFAAACLVAVAVALVMYWAFERNTPRVRRFLQARLGRRGPSGPRRVHGGQSTGVESTRIVPDVPAAD
jgi:hypothetical protein